ncbi:Uncharacterized protein GBIM_20551 [Gryllus bimaculatus]|nr:Uncharacterized protein GBIM_20551 [Gryllus bimaculatus]
MQAKWRTLKSRAPAGADSAGLGARATQRGLVFQFDKGADCEELLDHFFAALARNDSVRLVRFTAAEVARLAGYARLHTFELVITCLEDSAHDSRDRNSMTIAKETA